MADQTRRLRRRPGKAGMLDGIAAGRKGTTPKNMGAFERLFWWGCLLAGIVTLSAWVPDMFA